MSRYRKDLGATGEDQAVGYLKAKGFKILERNLRLPMGEVDLLAKKKGEIFFIEVKTRRSHKFGSPLEAITHEKKLRMTRLGNIYAKGYPGAVIHLSLLGIDFTYNPVRITFVPDITF